YVAHGDPAVFDQSHAVAVQAVTARTAAGRDRRGGGAGRRGKDRPVIGAPQAAARDRVQDRRALMRDPAPAQSIAANKYGTARFIHVKPFGYTPRQQTQPSS